jgi:S1-C subfamily serine protease
MRGIASNSADMEKYLMRIMGTAIQVGNGKLLTTGETIQAVRPNRSEVFVLAHIERQNVRVAIPYRIPQALRFVDPRTKEVNPTIDVALLLVPAKSTRELPYEIQPLLWGDSTSVGVGDPVMVAGYPLGTDLFLEYRSNRGFIQPTVYTGTIGAIIPAIQPSDTRLFRITVPGIGGISGGAVFSSKRGELLGMVTTSMHAATLPQPVIYAIPSEVLRPYVESVTFTTA